MSKWTWKTFKGKHLHAVTTNHAPTPRVYTTRGTVVIWVKICQSELMAEIYSKSLIRAIGKVLLIKFS